MNSVVGSRLAPVSRRFFSAGRILRNEPTEVHPGYKVIKEKQKLFQEVNGLSVSFLKICFICDILVKQP